MFHASSAVLALSREENATRYQKTLGLNDFYLGSDDFDFPLGSIQMIGKSQAQMFRGEKPGETRLAPEWTLERVAKHAIDFWLSTEDLPMPDNRVTLDKDGNVQLAYTPNNEEPKKQLYNKLKSMLGPLGMNADHLIHRFAYMKTDIPVAGCAHQAGTVRFGDDPASSALNRDCRAHEVDNLYVVDTSFFPSIGAVNPALTAMANALRVGDHVLERLGAENRGDGGGDDREPDMTAGEAAATIRSTIPARLDRLSWSPFHTRMVAGLGAAWILDGLQITIASSVTGVLIQPDTLDMTSTQVGLIASIYLVGQVVGALFFGRLSDQLGRKRLLVVTLLLYLLGTGLAAFTVNDGGWVWLVYFYATRFIAGMGIGGQYAAINSAIDEMMPSKYRGRVDIWINGSYWAGAILGSFASLDLPERIRPERRVAARVPDGSRARSRRPRRGAHPP